MSKEKFLLKLVFLCEGKTKKEDTSYFSFYLRSPKSDLTLTQVKAQLPAIQKIVEPSGGRVIKEFKKAAYVKVTETEIA